MLVQVLSDCHLECYKKFPCIKPKCEVLILAGDIGHIDKPIYEEFISYAARNWIYVVLVLGNHEIYSTKETPSELLPRYRNMVSRYPNVTLLEKEEIYINGYRILGTVLWSHLHEGAETNCLKKITSGFENGKRVKIGIDGMNALHQEAVEWLSKTYDPTIPSIIVSHYPMTQHPDYTRQERHRGESLDRISEFANPLIVSPHAQLVCISGHTHQSHDFRENNVRYISNQYGYPGESHTKITCCKLDGVFNLAEL
jgi:predicted phosphodiesterase